VYTLGLPSKKTARFMKIVTGYLNPFAKDGKSLDTIICDAHIIRQVFLMGNDTCYGPSNTDTTWLVIANGKRLELDKRVYASYDTSGQALYAFFPTGALSIVDKISIYQCSRAMGFQTFAKAAIAADMVTVTVEKLTPDAVQKIIDAYYRTFLENKARTSLGEGWKPRDKGNLKVSFAVTWEGKVTGVKIINCSRQYEKITQTIISDINAWTFPRLKNNTPPLCIEREFWF
jgi:hypothetical protein